MISKREIAAAAFLLILAGCATHRPLPDSLTAEEHARLGSSYEAQRKIEAAEAAYRRALGKQSGFFPAWFGLGNVLLASGRPREAETAFREAVRLRPDDPDAANNMAWAILESGGDAGEALRLAEQALSHGPAARRPYFLDTKGAALIRLHRAREAVETLTEAVRLSETLPKETRAAISKRLEEAQGGKRD